MTAMTEPPPAHDAVVDHDATLVSASACTPVAELAWSEDHDDAAPPAVRQSWTVTSKTAVLLLVIAGALAFAIGFSGCAWVQVNRQPGLAPAAPPPPPPTTMQAAPPTQPESSAADEDFLQTLRNRLIEFHDPGKAMFDGHRVCSELTDGYSISDVIVTVKGRDPALTYMGALDFMAAAIAFYCPQHTPISQGR